MLRLFNPREKCVGTLKWDEWKKKYEYFISCILETNRLRIRGEEGKQTEKFSITFKGIDDKAGTYADVVYTHAKWSPQILHSLSWDFVDLRQDKLLREYKYKTRYINISHPILARI